MDYYIGLAVGILGCLTVEIGHAVYKSVKRSREKKMFATESCPCVAIEIPKCARFPNLSKLVKGKDKIVWCDVVFWYMDWVDGYVCLEIVTPDKNVNSSGKVKEADIERLLEAQKMDAIKLEVDKVMGKSIPKTGKSKK